MSKAAFLELIRIAGSDAVRYAQSQFTNDVMALTDGGWQYSAWLSAKGRLLAFFPLMRFGPEELRIVVPTELTATLVPRLRMFVLRSRVTVEALGAPRASLGAEVRGPGVTLADGRMLCFEPAGSDEPVAENAWRLADIRAGLPRIVAANQDHFLLHALGLDRLPAVSLKKGCFPGQEIVARTHYLGRSKRRPVHIEGEGVAPDPHSELIAADQALGQLVDAIAVAEGWEALASAREDLSEALPAGLTASGQRITNLRELDAASASQA